MAEPLSLLASIISVGELAAGAGKVIKKVYRASNEKLALQNELNDLRCLLKQLEELTKKPWSEEQREYLQQASTILNDILSPKLEGLQTLHQKCAAGKFQRTVWLVLESRIKHERVELQRAKRQLLDIFHLIGDSTTARIDFQLSSVILGLDSQQSHTSDRHNEVLMRFDDVSIHQSRILDQLEVLTDEKLRLLPPFNQIAASSHHIQGSSRQATNRFSEHKGERNESRQEAPPAIDRAEIARTQREHESRRSAPRVFDYLLEGRQSRCPGFCGCSCHGRQRHIATPTLSDRIIGQLLLGFTVRPWLQAKCDEQQCRRRSKTIIRLRYSFPPWFVAYSLTMLISISTIDAPEFILRLPKVRAHGEEIFERVALGDIRWVQAAFTAGTASIHDVEDIGGHTLLHVSILEDYEEDRH